MKKILLITCLLLCLCGCGSNKKIVISSDNGIDVVSNTKSKTIIDVISSDIQYGERYFVKDYVSIIDGELINENEIITYDELGIQTITINYLDSNKKKDSYEFKINVIDTLKPIISADSSYSTYVGNDIDILSKVFIGDNYDRNLNIVLDGEYNINKKGTYKLTIKASDINGNTSSSKVNLIVKNKSTTSNPSTPSTTKYKLFSDIVRDYKTDNTQIGIDVSSWQNVINWSKVKAAGVEFVMIRMGFGYNSDGEFVVDKQFENNYKGARENNIKIGIYFYSYAKTIQEAKEHAQWVVKQLNGDKIDLPIVFDWESWRSFDDYKLNFLDINNIADAFNKEIIKNGYQAMQYGSKYKLNTIWRLPEYPTWLAHYTNKTNYDKDYVMWQLTNTGSVDGIDGAVDIDILYN